MIPNAIYAPEMIGLMEQRILTIQARMFSPMIFPFFFQNPPAPGGEHNPLFQSSGLDGDCRVACFSGRHDLTLAEMSPKEIIPVIDMWIDQVNELSQIYKWVQIFENKGAMMGCSNPHNPHCQIWGQNNLPTQALREN